MRLYLIEGLDCSGKKTLASLVAPRLAARGLDVSTCIGPLAGGALGTCDAVLTDSRYRDSGPRFATLLRTLRECVYGAGPVVDGVVARWRDDGSLTLKISSHYRAWARAQLDGSASLDAFLRVTHPLHVRYGGAVLLWASFDARLARHEADFASGRTQKDFARRFLGPSPERFERWHILLERLLRTDIPGLLTLDTGKSSMEECTNAVVSHALATLER